MKQNKRKSKSFVEIILHFTCTQFQTSLQFKKNIPVISLLSPLKKHSPTLKISHLHLNVLSSSFTDTEIISPTSTSNKSQENIHFDLILLL